MMRLRHPSGSVVHLAYCTNVHPAEDLAGVVRQLDDYAVPVRNRLGADSLGLGLWLAAPTAAALATDRTLRLRLRRELDRRGLEVVTLNGFPYEAFHAPVVKHAVYRPDWTDPARLRYTLDLATILADLLPDREADGSVSTLPFAWRTPWTQRDRIHAGDLLAELSAELAALHRSTGRLVRVGVEPEPGCVVERTEQALAELATVDHDYIGVCLDLAHLACAWEDPAVAVASLVSAGVPIVKVQVSAALEVADPAAAREVLGDYAEPRFLHQTRTLHGEAFDDLPEALAADAAGPWRIHFHVPIHAPAAPPLAATTGVLRSAIAAVMAANPPCEHLEVETYTWGVLPSDRRPTDAESLAGGIAAELAFARDELFALGLTPISAAGVAR